MEGGDKIAVDGSIKKSSGPLERLCSRNPEEGTSHCGSVDKEPAWCPCDLDPALLWLWHRPATAAQIQLLAQKLPCVAGAALKRKRKKK